MSYQTTTTVDCTVVLKSPVVLIVNDKEVELQTGDCVIQRGAAHSWHNYTNETAILTGVILGVMPPQEFIRTDSILPS